MNRLIFLFIRALFSLSFIVNGVQKLAVWQEAVNHLQFGFSHWCLWIRGVFPSWGMCEFLISNASIFLGIALACEIGGALLILTGVKIRLGAFFLLVFMIPFTLNMPLFFWERRGDHVDKLLDFFKNLALIGALLYFFLEPRLKSIRK